VHFSFCLFHNFRAPVCSPDISWQPGQFEHSNTVPPKCQVFSDPTQNGQINDNPSEVAVTHGRKSVRRDDVKSQTVTKALILTCISPDVHCYMSEDSFLI